MMGTSLSLIAPFVLITVIAGESTWNEDHCDSPHSGVWICTFANGTYDTRYEWGNEAECVAACHSVSHGASQQFIAQAVAWEGHCSAPCVCVGPGVGGLCKDLKQGNATAVTSLKACEDACDTTTGCNGEPCTAVLVAFL
jgi:hypothetical protein